MSEEKKTTYDKEKKEGEAQVGEIKQVKDSVENNGTGNAPAKSNFARKFKRTGKPRANEEKKDEFEQRILDLARVTRVMAGGKRMRFRACVAIGDKKGKIGVALGKGADVTIAVNKAVNKAKKNILQVPMVKNTIPHEVYKKHGASKILFKPARKGRGVIAGGVVRVILELAGVHNVTSKIFGTSNKVSNAQCTIEALRELRLKEDKTIRTENQKKTIEK